MPEKPACYGTMFPDLTRMECNTPCHGKAFTVLAMSEGMGVQSPRLTVDASEWDDCQQCRVYRSCYDLCTALLSLRSALDRV